MSEPQEYTTAVIVAVPAADDPVHQFVTEDAHITLHFMGEAQNLPVGAADQIQTDLAVLAEAIYPFPADVSGTAILGDDQANVLLIESEPLARIREILGNTEPVAEACSTVKQFPNWIPHLTLAYPDAPAAEGELVSLTSSPVDTVTIGGLALWLGGDKFEFPFSKAAPGPVEEDYVVASAITAALGNGKFDPSLHPRGADGRFIEKLGIVKFLSGNGAWAYGKVTGISKDEHEQVKIEVTPSDLSGKTSGAPKELLPKQIYEAPKAKAHLTTTAIGAKKIGGQGGSNPGGLYTIPKPGSSVGQGGVVSAEDKYYVKKPKTKSHGQNEALANDLYAEAGVPVPEVDLHADGQLYSKIVDGQQDMASKLNDPEWVAQVQRNFAVDAWLGNRDVFGMSYDNVLTDANGIPWRIDNGGALLYRAMGEKKTDFGSQVTELDAFRTGKKAKIYGPQMPKEYELDGAQRVLAILPSRIEEMVSEAGLPKSLADTLKARRVFIANYYGLELPETKKAPGAQEGSVAPLVDAADLSAHNGKARDWFKVKLNQAALLLSAGDSIEFPDGSQTKYGVDGTYSSPLSIVGQQAQILSWQQEYGADASVMFKKAKDNPLSRPIHGDKIAGADLSGQNWQRGDKLVSLEGKPFKILGANPSTGAMLLQHDDDAPWLMDSKGVQSASLWTVERWDPPAPKVEPVPEVAPAPVEQQIVAEPKAPDLTPNEPATSYPFPPVTVIGKTGQGAQAESAIKADLNTPLPTGNGTPAPKPDTTPAASGKGMLIGDGSVAEPGADLVSNKDGKTYTFLKKKGQYAVVTDPNGDDPTKQLLKLASTMTQPGAAPAVDTGEIEKPKTATGEIPALGMMAVSKDGHAGEITLISPDGKFVFITDANGKRKRKSTGTVTITSAPVSSAPAVDTPNAPAAPQPGPVKPYGSAPSGSWSGEEKASSWAGDPGQLVASNMVHVGYADGSQGLEPYTGQPIGVLETNATGKIAVYGDVHGYMGPIAASQLAQAEQAASEKTTYQVIFSGNVFFTDGTTGPSGGLVLWYADDNNGDVPGTEAWEVNPGSEQILTITGTEAAAAEPLTMPEGIGFQAADEAALPASPPPLYGEEAKTLSQLQGKLSEGSEISLDGQTWMEVTAVNASGSVNVMTGNGQTVFLNAWSNATYVVKAPDLKNADAPAPEVPAEPDLPGVPPAGKKAVGELTGGDWIVLDSGTSGMVNTISALFGDTVMVELYGQDTKHGLKADQLVTHTGNTVTEPVDANVHAAFPILQPGSTLDTSETMQLTVVGYPHKNDDGSWMIAAIKTGEPESVFPMYSDDFGPEKTLPIKVGSWTAVSSLGVDQANIDKVYNPPVDTAPIDHHSVMADQGIDFQAAQYPIFYNETDSSYYRNGPTGVEGWENGAWKADPEANIAAMTKAWDGKPFEGSLNIPAGTDLSLYGQGSADYKPNPGEAVAIISLPSGNANALVVSPSGSFEPGNQIFTVGGDGTLMPNGYDAINLNPGGIGTLTVIHDPFADSTAPTPTLNHHEGPQPPSALGAFMQQFGHTPEPGKQYFYAVKTSGSIQRAWVKQDDGTWSRLLTDGSVGGTIWYDDDLFGADGFDAAHGFDSFTYTYVPDGTESPVVQGMPDGYPPFVPGEGQTVLKHTSVTGVERIYVQKQPGGGWHKLNTDGSLDDTPRSNSIIQMKLAGNNVPAGAKYEILHPAASAATPPTLTNNLGDWTPEPGQKVVSLVNGPSDTDPWFYVQQPDGVWIPAPNTPSYANDQSADQMQANLNQANWKFVYGEDTPAVDTAAPATPDAPATPAETPSFGHHTPAPGTEVYKDDQGDFWAQKEPGGKYYWVKPNGDYSLAGLTPDNMSGYEKVWPTGDAASPAASGPAGVFEGYQTEPGDSVVQVIGPAATQYLVKKAGASKWQKIENGQLKTEFDQDSVEFVAGFEGNTTNVLQGQLKGGEPEPLKTEGKYPGVAQTTALKGAWKLADGNAAVIPSSYVSSKLDGVTLQPGESAWYVPETNGAFVRTSTGQWNYIYSALGETNLEWTDDAAMEQYLSSSGKTLIQVVPTSPSAAPSTGPSGIQSMTGWEPLGIPDPTTFKYLASASDGIGAKAGDWVFMANPNKPGSGVFAKLGEDWMAGNVYMVAEMQAYEGSIPSGTKLVLNKVSPFNFDTNVGPVYISGGKGGESPQVPVAAPSATQAAENVPVPPVAKPSYPGAQKPSQEDINAWGGSLTKDGHIPSAGMFVSGKGPMTGKIISVSKDKTKAVVLKADGTKTTRLIEALKTDASANYSAYAAPVTLKDIPSGMPLAVDTVAEALTKTVKDGKFRAILNGHPGVSQGQMVVTKATAPSGKAYNRVHLTLTPAQREQLMAMLAGTGEKGDWSTSSKQSQDVAIGDQLPMRLSSTANPDGSPRWKVDPAITPPTHTVTKVEDEPGGSGIKIVTMTNNATGEVITSRFHPNKTLTTYAWDPNKPKPVAANSFSLSDLAKAQGWTNVTDGGISAVKGGAENGTLYVEPGKEVPKSASAFHDIVGYSGANTLRNVSADGVVIELFEPKGPNKNSSTGVTVVSVPEGVGEQALGAALAKMGIDYRPMNQDDAKVAVRGVLRTLLNLDTSDVDTPKHYTDEMLFAQAGKSMGITDLGWHDVLIGVDDTTGKTSFFWSDRARNALAAKTSYNLIYRSANTADAAAIVSTVKYGSANSVLKRTTGMIDTPSGKGTGASWSSDQANHAGHGSYSSAGKVGTLPTGNSQASYKHSGMMVYSRPEAVLGRIADFRLANSDAFGMGQGQGADHLKAATTMSKVTDFFIGGGLPTEAVGFIAVSDNAARTEAIAKLKADGFAVINGRPIEEIVILKSQAQNMKPSDLPPVTLPANARPITDLPVSYDAPTAEVAA